MLTTTATASSTAKPTAANAALMKQAKALEGVFLNTLTSQMFSSIKTDGMFGGGFGEQTWRSIQSEQMANDIAQSGGVGLAAQITRNLLDEQQAAVAPDSTDSSTPAAALPGAGTIAASQFPTMASFAAQAMMATVPKGAYLK